MSENTTMIRVHYGELSIKGKNQKEFIKQLIRNIRSSLKTFDGINVTYNRDYAFVTYENEDDVEEIIERLQDVSGISKLSLVHKVSKDIEEIKEAVLETVKDKTEKTFKVEVKRADKTYPLDSYGIARAVASHVLKNTEFKVDVHNPDFIIYVDLRREYCLITTEFYKGAGGYPLGMNGKALMLLSGGIDSPVAAYLMLRRGIKVDCIHFASPPYTSTGVIDKLEDIIGQLNNYQADIAMHIVTFTKLQEAIFANVPEPYCITIMRRMMMRIAVEVAKKNKCLALATGENVGQVASQTLDSLIAINDVTNYPIVRPLAVMDKLEIIDIAKKIDTYDISIVPYEDACTIFAPKNPKTKPRVATCEEYEALFDWEPLLQECLDTIEVRYYRNEDMK